MTVKEAQQYQRILTARFAELKGEMTAHKLKGEELEEQFRQVEQELWDLIEGLGLPSVTTSQGTFVKSRQVYPKVDDMIAFEMWCNETNQGPVFLRTDVNKPAFNEYIKGLLADGEPLPPGAGEPTERRFITFRRG